MSKRNNTTVVPTAIPKGEVNLTVRDHQRTARVAVKFYCHGWTWKRVAQQMGYPSPAILKRIVRSYPDLVRLIDREDERRGLLPDMTRGSRINLTDRTNEVSTLKSFITPSPEQIDEMLVARLSGFSWKDISEKFAVRHPFHYVRAKFGRVPKVVGLKRQKSLETITKNESIVSLRQQGMSLQEIADEWGMTRERVRQILRDSGHSGRIVLTSPIQMEKAHKRREREAAAAARRATRAAKRALLDERADWVVAMRGAGMGWCKISSMIGLTKSGTIAIAYNRLMFLGVSPDSREWNKLLRPRKMVSPTERRSIKRMAQSGMTFTEIHRRTGRSLVTISKIVRSG